MQSSGVVRVIHQDRQLKCLKTKRAQHHAQANLIQSSVVVRAAIGHIPNYQNGFFFSTDEKIFSVAPPMNSQNDRIFAPVTTVKRDISAPFAMH